MSQVQQLMASEQAAKAQLAGVGRLNSVQAHPAAARGLFLCHTCCI